MSNEATLIFPHQLFSDHPALTKSRKVFLIEDPRYFTDFAFHKKKLVLHRASMKAYAVLLKKRGYNVNYLDYKKAEKLALVLQDKKITAVHYADLVDIPRQKTLNAQLKKAGVESVEYDTPQFLLTHEQVVEKLKDKKTYRMHNFYVQQRKDLNILIHNGKPVGGKWSFDQDNRQKMPSDTDIPPLNKPRVNDYVREAVTYVDKNFADNPGTTENFFYPVTHAQAKSWLDKFLQHRLKNFGIYQDAMVPGESFLFHSLLSCSINNGLLAPNYVVETTLAHAKKHRTPINSLEGFIRQIIGWREYVRGVYILEANNQRTENFFKHRRSMPKAFWTAKTTIAPVDDVIKRVLDNAYAHHIERLMILGNIMLLCEIKPDDVYVWFMELFIDAYDWVMVPNVYGMSQYADGGLMTTKPYISGSNYIKKMSSYKSGEWCNTWNALYWNFIYEKRTIIKNNARLRMMHTYLQRMKPNTLVDHKTAATTFWRSLKK